MKYPQRSQTHSGPPSDADGAAAEPPSNRDALGRRVFTVEECDAEAVAVGARRRATIAEAERNGDRTCATCRYANVYPAKVYALAVTGLVPNSEAQCRRSIPKTWTDVNLTDWCGEWGPKPSAAPAVDVVGAREGLPESGLTAT